MCVIQTLYCTSDTHVCVCVLHVIRRAEIDDNYELLCRLRSPLVGEEGGGGCQPVTPVALRVNDQLVINYNDSRQPCLMINVGSFITKI